MFKASKCGNEQMGKLDGRVALITGAVVALDSRQPRHLLKRGLMLLLLVGVKQNSIDTSEPVGVALGVFLDERLVCQVEQRRV